MNSVCVTWGEGRSKMCLAGWILGIIALLCIVFYIHCIYKRKLKHDKSERLHIRDRFVILQTLFWRLVNFFHEKEIMCVPLYGTLLGLVRNGDILCHDDDIDLGIVDFQFKKGCQLLKKEFIEKYPEYEFTSKRYLWYVDIDVVHKDSGLHADIACLHNRSYFPVDSLFPLNYSEHLYWPSRCIFPLRFDDQINLWMPNNPMDFLKHLYGLSWEISDHVCTTDCRMCRPKTHIEKKADLEIQNVANKVQ
jgi:hypothetical protein